MELESERLIFKEITIDDLEIIHQMHLSPEVAEFGTLGIPKDIEETKERVNSMIRVQTEKNRKSYDWKIITKESNSFIGLSGISLSLDKFKLGEIYYELHPNSWGNGYGTEISKELIRTGFDKFHLHKVEAGVATENIKSVRILEKCGMTREGLRRKILPIRGEWIDNYHYAIVEDDPRQY
ncbi:GNAT family N-acetyltransferase [Ancylomarina sp. DW003]|nr:GNAT family protein [Ancylomarina sp. DW003]MDE5423704.1 GNAT family N-acetyltransferase [Ancylomarina sp. DW003]